MFRINSEVHVQELTFSEAVDILTRSGNKDLLKAMEDMDAIWKMHVDEHNDFARGNIDETTYGDDDDFFSHWTYECSAYNVVFENMGKLFAPKEVA